jgi:nicotinamidase-related amidase
MDFQSQFKCCSHVGVAKQRAQPSMTVTAALGNPIEKLTPDNAVLLLIDHQIGPLWELEFSGVRQRAAELARVARERGVPTIVTAMDPEEFGWIIPELTIVQPDAPVVVRSVVNAWDEPTVRGAIEATRRSKLIIAGSATEVGVVLCALSAAEAGYDVYAPVDASGQPSHRALARLSRAGVTVTTTSLVVGELTPDADDADDADALRWPDAPRSSRRRGLLVMRGGA